MGFYPELWGAKTLQQLRKALLSQQRIVNSITDYTPFVKGKAASGYHGPKIASMTAVDLPASDSDINDPSKLSVDINFDQKKGVPFYVKSIEEAQSNINILTNLTADAKDGLLDAYDLYIIKQMILNLASANRKTLADTTDNKLTEADFIAAKKILNNAKAPLRGRFCAINPEHEADLYAISNFISRDKIPDTKAVKDGVIGRLHGFDIILYNDMPKVDSNGVFTGTQDKNVTLFYSKLAYGFGRQLEFGTSITEKPLLPGKLVNIYSVFGGTIQFDTYAVSYRDNVIT